MTINPISQMREVKAVANGGDNATTSKTQSEAHKAISVDDKPKATLNPLSFKMSQFSRQFELIKQANARCKENFPDCFHHKHKLAEELNDLTEILRDGQALIKRHNGKMTEAERKQARRFNSAVNYLTYHFKAVCEDVAALSKAGGND